MDIFKKKVEEDAKNAIKLNELAELNALKDNALNELRSAVLAVRALAVSENQGGDAMEPAKLRVAAAVQAATRAGLSQQEIAEASSAVLPPAPSLAPGEDEEGSAGGATDEHGFQVKASEKTDPGETGGLAENKVKRKNRHKLAREAARAAALEAKEAGKSKGEIAKAATAAAKAAGGDGNDISAAAVAALKIASDEIPEQKDDGSSSSSSSSSSSDSESAEQEEPIAAKDAAKAKRDGIAAVFYFGIGANGTGQ